MKIRSLLLSPLLMVSGKNKDDKCSTDLPHAKKSNIMNQNHKVGMNQDITKYFSKKKKPNKLEMASSSNELSSYEPMDTTSFDSNLGFIPNPDGVIPASPPACIPGCISLIPSEVLPVLPGPIPGYNPLIPPVDCFAPHYLEHPT